jgi:tRNA(Ile2) C34 agmatinyltransferase TiaS
MRDETVNVCPQCDGDLEPVGAHWHCAECDLTFF